MLALFPICVYCTGEYNFPTLPRYIKMKIAVCIKQVPGTTQVEIDPVTGTLKRDGVASKMNPYDLYALETALRIKALTGAELTAISMGPPQATAVLKEAFMMGADKAFLISDRKFGGADVLATSRTIFQGLKATGPFDLIICGKQTTDGDTAQVGSELAEFFGIPHVTGVCAIGAVTENDLTVEQEFPSCIMTAKLQYPCLITVDKGIFEPRLPSYKLKKATKDREIGILTLDSMEDKDPQHYGLNGSPTKVKRIFPPERSVSRESWEGPESETAEKLFDYLDRNKFLQIPG